MSGKLWIIYDERAAGGNTDDALVLETCRSKHEAFKRACCEGIVYEYDADEVTRELTNGRMLGPNASRAERSRR